MQHATKKDEQGGTDDQLPSPATQQEVDETESGWPVFVQKAVQGAAERDKPIQPDLVNCRYLSEGSGALAEIDEGKLSYAGGLWLVNQRAVRLSSKTWWLPNLSSDQEEDRGELVLLKVIAGSMYELHRKRVGAPKNVVCRDLLVVIGVSNNRKPTAIADVSTTLDPHIGARYVSNFFGISFDAKDLVDGQKIYLM
ncbi:hypothetical protein [Ferrimicrobium acidiphilum]|uniref:hypothetical protein n=1 Tax=Ferrimicrobium acidiphilum TaxID=121039 RepID=UPI0023F32DEC|nr:hypothetical protein [Ferrimicrobium acidiphilum]